MALLTSLRRGLIPSVPFVLVLLNLCWVGPSQSFQYFSQNRMHQLNNKHHDRLGSFPVVNGRTAPETKTITRDSDEHELSLVKRAQKVALATTFAFATFLGTGDISFADDAMISDPTSVSVLSTSASTVRSGLNARRYWNIMASREEGSEELKRQANEGLVDYAVATVNTMYYDNTGGARFNPREFYDRWRALRDKTRQQQQLQQQQGIVQSLHTSSQQRYRAEAGPPSLVTRAGTVENLKWLISTLNDPFSKYLTREELWQELNIGHDGFLGTGALVETPEQGHQFFSRGSAPTFATVVPEEGDILTRMKDNQYNRLHKNIPPLSAGVVQNLPMVTAVVPDSPAERSGVTVGDRIVAVGEYSFLGRSTAEVSRNFQTRFSKGTSYFGTSDVTIAKPVVRTLLSHDEEMLPVNSLVSTSSQREREVVIGYRQARVRLPTMSSYEDSYTKKATTSDLVFPPTANVAYVSHDGGKHLADIVSSKTSSTFKGGNAIVHWELLSFDNQVQPASIFQRSIARAVAPSSEIDSSNSENDKERFQHKVGYIRLTRFSKLSTAGYVEAVQALEQAGATSYIIDVRNNYGGVIQEAMLTASTLLRDPHAVLCYTLNSRGGFGPHDVEEYLVDQRYPGYFMSREPRWVTLKEAQLENPDYFEDGGRRWTPPSSYASLHEQTVKRGIHRPKGIVDISSSAPSWLLRNAATKSQNDRGRQQLAQKNLVVLVNEGTASAAEVFASSLHDNGRTLAVVGTNTYGKGLIQHNFPMPDGGALRLTVAEYLTPALHHVTAVGNAKFDALTGDQVGGGIKPDLHCASSQGIPANVGADLCVGMALDVLEEAEETPPLLSPSSPNHHHHQQERPKTHQREEDASIVNGILAKTSESSLGGSNVSILNASANSKSWVASWDALERKIRASLQDE